MKHLGNKTKVEGVSGIHIANADVATAANH